MTIKSPVTNCARCGGDHDEPLIFTELTKPMAPAECAPLQWTHWTSCPANGQPIMMAVETTVAMTTGMRS